MIENINAGDLTSLNNMASNFDLTITIEDLSGQNNHYIGYAYDNKLVAFLCYSIYYERAELNYVFVLPEYRNRKIATKLLEHTINEVKNLDNITLEVRESNTSAIKLYEKQGFKKCAIRKNYYGSENAILMIKNFGDNNE